MAAFILGIASVVGIPILDGGALIAGILAIVFGIKGRKETPERKSLANTGLTLGIIGVAVMVIGAIAGLLTVFVIQK